LELPVERWHEAIFVRRSRRSFDGAPLAAELLDALQAHCRAFRPFADARVNLLPVTADSLYVATRRDAGLLPTGAALFGRVTGAYGRVSGAPSALVVIAAEDSPNVQEHAGYAGEAAVLEATALGLDTCWVGGFFSPSTTAGLADLQPGERILAVSPVGRAAERHTRKERLLFQTGEKQKKRKELELIAPGLLTQQWPAWALDGLRAAQRAPSAVNRQPWRFRLEGNDVLVAYDGEDSRFISKRLDCGIAMLHFELGALHAGAQGAWEPVAPQAGLTDIARWHLAPAAP
jgi:nitroreductase